MAADMSGKASRGRDSPAWALSGGPARRMMDIFVDRGSLQMSIAPDE